MEHSLRYEPEGEVTFERLEESTVLVHLGTGRIFHTNATASRIWELLQAGQSLGEILATLQAEFDAPRDRLQAELETFVGHLSSEKIIRLIENRT